VKLRIVLSSLFAEMQAEAARLEGELVSLGEELHTRGEAVHVMEAEHTERTQRGYTIDDESKQTRTRLSEVTREIDRAHARTRTNEERVAELVSRSVGSEAEIAKTTGQLARLEEELLTNQQVLESAAADVAAA